MAEFKLGRLKFVWKGDWAASTAYVRDDIVRFGGRTYVCKSAHTSTSNFYTELTASKWELHTEGFEYKNEWAFSTYYKVRDVVTRGGNSYVCNTAHTSASTNAGFDSTDANNWTLLTSGFSWRGIWANSTYYKVGDVTKDGANVYLCTENHTSASSGEFGNDPAYSAKWDHFVDGFQFEDSWNDAANYEEGDVVAYGGYVYISKTHNTNKNPSTETADWELFTTGFKTAGTWSTGITYKIGSVVRYGGNVYVAKRDTFDDPPPTNADDWELLVSGFNWRGDWNVANTYKIGDTVKRGLSSYIALSDHSSTVATDPQTNNVVWATLAEGDSSDVLTTAGDIIIRGASGTERLPVGTPNQVLVVDPGSSLPSYSSNITVVDGTFSDQVFVGPNATTEVDGGGGTYNLTDARVVMKSDVDSFAQIGIINANDGTAASTDIIAYTDNGDNDSGWIDMGITSSNFDASSGYGITDINDGYIFMSAPAGTTGPGNLVIATDANGTENDIVFCTGGFDSTVNLDAEKMRIVGEGRVGTPAGVIINIDTAATSPETGALRVVGGVGIQGDLYTQGNVVVNGNVQIYGGSEQFSAENLVVTNPVIFVGDTNPDDLYDLAFIGEYSNRTQLNGAINDLVTTITVDSTTDFPSAGTIKIDNELITYTGKTSTTFTGCTRGASSTTAASHTDDTAVSLTRYSGLVRNHLDKTWYFLDKLTVEPTNTVDFTQTELDYAKIKIGSIEITDTTVTTSFSTGAFTVQGGMGVKGDIFAGGRALFGNDIGGGALGGATNPIGQFIADDDNYAQVYIFNRNNGTGASADLIAYPDNGTDSAGFIDMGITSSTFDYADFAVTSYNEGYIFMSAPDNTTSGNLVIATDGTGSSNHIVIYTGGYDDLSRERIRIGNTGTEFKTEVTINATYNITAQKAPTTANHLTNKQYTDSNFNAVAHAVLYDPLTGTLSYVTESKTTAGTIPMDFERFDMAFINNSQSTVSLDSTTGHLQVTLA